jgi:hypothetical protein
MLTNKYIISIFKSILNRPNTIQGICLNIRSYCATGNEYFFIKDKVGRLVKNWPNHSGDEHFFIYDNCDIYADGEVKTQYFRYESVGGLWKNRQGELRRECLRFLIAELEKEDLINANQ